MAIENQGSASKLFSDTPSPNQDRQGRRKALKRCTKCILPESYPRIAFNEQGTCNYCLTHEKAGYKGEAELIRLVEPYRDSNRGYDCIVAVSGGRDSAYAAYYAVRVLNLRVLAYTGDGGFLPEQTKENIKNIVDELGIDHVVVKHGYVQKNVKHIVSSWMHKPSPAMVSFLCTGCQAGVESGLIKTAQDNKIPLIITGHGEPERSFAETLLSISTNIKGKKLSLFLGFLMESIRNPYYLLSPHYSVTVAKEFFYRYSQGYDKGLRRVPFFEFIEWDEQMILSVIQKELKWKNPPHSKSSWRSDCKIHLLKQYLYRETLGFTKNDELMSGMIRDDMMTRESALRRLEDDNRISRRFLIALFDELGLNFSDLDMVLREYKNPTTTSSR